MKHVQPSTAMFRGAAGKARHMVAGDSNDRFSDAVLAFVGRLANA
jgi:hypothetical protein